MKTLCILLLGLTTSVRAQSPGRTEREILGPAIKRAENAPRPAAPCPGADVVHRWNQIAINATGLDHTPVEPGENRIFGEQIGPARSSRAMGIVHIAIFDAINAAGGLYQSYTGVQSHRDPLSIKAAVSQAAHDTLAALYPSQAASFDGWLAEDLAQVKNHAGKRHGVNLGRRVAAAVLALRSGDGSETPEPVIGEDFEINKQPGHWRKDPVSRVPIALGAHWGECKPFVLSAGNQFRVPPPPALSSAAYAAAFNETKQLGGDGVQTPTIRTAEQTFIGTFWAYDGTPSLCAPPRLYNQIAVQIADKIKLPPLQLARLLTLVNVALADSGIAAWESKFYYDFWRPITGIRQADPHHSPTGLGDGNPHTAADPSFLPLGAPATNLTGPNFTPPFPSYPSGHATFGGALFQVLRRFYDTDQIGFTFVSDEFNGVTKGNDGVVRPYTPRSFSSLSQAEEENGQSRIYLGIHWAFDKTEGITQGRHVADYVFDHAFLPQPH